VGLPGAEGRPLAGVGFEAGADAVSLTLDELAEASGLTLRDIRDLERFGLIEPRDGSDGTHYDGDALIVARTAAGFLQHGIEARHMRSYKVAVDREAGLFEQIVSPLLKQRNPEARIRATRTVSELIRLGEVMRGVLLRRELRDHIGGA
jgi:DNA-binding transcriptional MerR regulator